MLLNGCDNTNDKKENVDKNDRSERRVKMEKIEEEPLTYEEEKWLAFKEETEASLRFNWAHIIELRGKIRRQTASQNALLRLDSLERRYEALETRYDHYNKKGLPNFDSFSRQYSKDMKELNKALYLFNIK
jgi:hypothetical protein